MTAEQYLRTAIQESICNISNSDNSNTEIELVRTRSKEHGDIATNVAMKLAKQLKKNPREIAASILQVLELDKNFILKSEIAGPGFINFYYNPNWIYHKLEEILKAGKEFGHNKIGGGKKAQVEFVSANPTGPLTIGHGRQACLGDTIANILAACGYEVDREYYFNDAGRQMRMLGDSVRLRYLALLGDKIEFPEDHYQGEYIIDIAKTLKVKFGDSIREDSENPVFKETAEQFIFQDIKNTLQRLSIEFDSYYNEKSLYENGDIDQVISDFKQKSLAYEKDGAVWLKTTELGLEQDRVIVKSTGEPTYRLPDIAYHKTKFERNYDLLIDLFGADHIATYPDVIAALKALGYDTTIVKVLIHQFVTLTEGNEKVKMSTRKANFVTLDELMDIVGVDVTRYFFLMRGMNTHLNFDLSLAKTHSDENPVFYIQYAHARICNIEKYAFNQGVIFDRKAQFELLKEEVELNLIRKMIDYPGTLLRLHNTLEPQNLTQYLTEFSANFHKFYFDFRVVTDNPELSKARLALVSAVKSVLANGLKILGISAPEKM